MSDPQAGWAAGFVEPLRVRPGSKVARPAPPGAAADPAGRTPPR
jgi:hypothetical protein